MGSIGRIKRGCAATTYVYTGPGSIHTEQGLVVSVKERPNHPKARMFSPSLRWLATREDLVKEGHLVTVADYRNPPKVEVAEEDEPVSCAGTKSNGEPCKSTPTPGEEFCRHHAPKE